jgi:CRISPR/Cas system CSM-associated protein Csm3 (group 7 of RAMP superfamily)
MPPRSDRLFIRYELLFTTPFHMGTGLRRGLVHRAVSRDRDGSLFIPGSTIKGNARERSEQIARLFGLETREPHVEGADLTGFSASVQIVDTIFGSRTHPGSLWFDDAPLCEEDQALFEAPSPDLMTRYREFQVEPRTRVSMSRLTGTTRHGQLFASEYGLAGLRFHGLISGVLNGASLPDERANASYTLLLLLAGILAVDRLGSNRSAGAGGCYTTILELRVNGQEQSVESLLDYIPDLEYYALAGT